jgi:hypothetical protein
VVMADPDGHEFCVLTPGSATRPSRMSSWGGLAAHPSRDLVVAFAATVSYRVDVCMSYKSKFDT